MANSGLRLRLTGGFALAFGVGLALLAVVALGYLRRESRRRLDAQLEALASGVGDAMLRELRETPDSSMAYAAHEVRIEWPSETDRWVIVRPDGSPLSATDSSPLTTRMIDASRRARARRFSVDHEGRALKAVTWAAPASSVDGHDWRYDVVAWRSTEGIEQDARLLASSLAVAAPLLVLFSLGAGYLMATRALRPARELGQAIAALSPEALSQRLPHNGSDDEIGTLAHEFNRLLDRLEHAQERNQRFVREAAHQIRTPLTLVLGEADVEQRQGAPDPRRTRATLQRIQTAATVMRHRVDDLLLLAEAQAGSKPRLEEIVELDGLVLECTDLMRARAASAGRSLALGEIAPAAVRGNAQLLREALLELLENGCRHASGAGSVTTEVVMHGDDRASICVSTPQDGTVAHESSGSGLGTRIVQWIAAAHGGTFEARELDEAHVATLTLPTVSPVG